MISCSNLSFDAILNLILTARKWQKSFCKGWWACIICIADTHRVDFCLEWVLIWGRWWGEPRGGKGPRRPSIAKRTEDKWLSGVWTVGFSQLKLPQGWQLNSTFLTGVQSSLHSIAAGNNAALALVVFASAAHHLLGCWVCFSLRNLSVNESECRILSQSNCYHDSMKKMVLLLWSWL